MSLVVLLAVAPAAALGACGGDDGDNGGGGAADQEPGGERALEHIHGLGVDPADDALIIATHFGLFRVPEGEQEPVPVGESEQDVMGFSVIGADHFLGSGHPSAEQSDLPPNLGLIESQDGGETWENVSLLGEADFHVLRAAGERVYGVNSADGMLMASENGGQDWEERTPPGPVIDLAIDPDDPEHVVISTDEQLFESPNGGAGWRPLAEAPPGLVAWPDADALYKVDAQGAASVSDDGGRSWREAGGSIGGQPVAFAAADGDLYAALADTRVMRSSDGGASWQVRAAG